MASRSNHTASPFSSTTSFIAKVDIDQPTEKTNARNPTARIPSFQFASCQRVVKTAAAAIVWAKNTRSEIMLPASYLPDTTAPIVLTSIFKSKAIDQFSM